MKPTHRHLVVRVIASSLLYLGLSATCSAALGTAPINQQSAGIVRSQILNGASPGKASYTVRANTLASGTLVKEYVGQNGAVFAVSWSGPFLPDLKELLGEHFSVLTAESARLPKAGRGQILVSRPDLSIESTGHMRAYSGRAWIHSMLPAGVQPEDIK